MIKKEYHFVPGRDIDKYPTPRRIQSQMMLAKYLEEIHTL